MDGFKKIEIYQKALGFEELEDYREAFKLFLSSAKQGYAKAQLAVAKYYLGVGRYKGVVKADKKQGVEYLLEASAGGNAEAKYMYAVVLLEEDGEEKAAVAVEYLKEAFNLGFKLAAFELAKCYKEGKGCKRNCRKAVELIAQIIYKGDDSAQKLCYNGIVELLKSIKNLSGQEKEKLNMKEDDWILFYDLCADMDIYDEE